jgi:hypothetical protein
MESARLEQLQEGLRQVLRLVERDESGGATLAPDHPAVRAARAVELMLPQPLTAHALANAARAKIETVAVLLARAREHESLPPELQEAADSEYLSGMDAPPADDASDLRP